MFINKLLFMNITNNDSAASMCQTLCEGYRAKKKADFGLVFPKGQKSLLSIVNFSVLAITIHFQVAGERLSG